MFLPLLTRFDPKINGFPALIVLRFVRYHAEKQKNGGLKTIVPRLPYAWDVGKN